MLDVMQDIGTVQIGTESYRLVRAEGEHPRLAWEETFEDEDAFQGGTPNILSEPASTWHLGGFKSREGIPGTSEYGQNTDGRWPNRLLPGPEFTEIVLTDSTSAPADFFEAFGELFVVAGGNIYRIDPSDDSVTLSKDLGSDNAREGISWEGTGVVGASTSAPITAKLYRITAVGAPDTWGVGTAQAFRVAAGLDRIFKIDYGGVLKNCLAGLDPTSEANWSDAVQCGDSDKYSSALVAYENTALVGKSDGLFGVSAEGKGKPLIKRMAPGGYNCRGMYVLEPYVLVPTQRELLRYMPGSVESVGLEKEVLNESPIRGYFTAFASDGQWVYASLSLGGDTHILVAREAREGEASLGPYIWDTLVYIDTSNSAHAIHVSRLWTPPRIWVGHNSNVAYGKLSAGGGAPDPDGTDYRFVVSCTRFTRRYNFGTWQDKDFVKVDLVVKNASVDRYWVLAYDINGAGSYLDVDIDGVQMKANSDGLWTFYLPTTAKGREIQFRFTYTGDANTSKAELTHFKPYAVPTGLKLRRYNLTLYLADDIRHNGGVERRSSVEQLNDLYALTESVAAVDCKGPWGDITVHPRRMRMLEASQEGHEPPRFLVEFVAQKRKTP